MFRVELYVEDKKLPQVLMMVVGLTIGAPQVQPVLNAKKKGGRLRAIGSGDPVELLVQHLEQQKLKEFGPRVIREWAPTVGLSEKSYSNVLGKAMKAGVIKRRTLKGGGEGKYLYTLMKGG